MAKNTVISFDAGDTLFHGNLFRFMSELSNFPKEVIVEKFSAAIKETEAKWLNIDVFSTDSALSAYWSDIYRKSLMELFADDDIKANLIYSRLMYEREHGGSWYETNEGVREILSDLGKNSFRLIVSSNWSTDLEKILSNLNIINFFSKVYTSANLGFSKPSEDFFRKISQEEKTKNIIHFGDDIENDVKAPKEFGWRDGILFGKGDRLDKLVNKEIFHLLK
jgi:FMN phosphatase YigB (HAD superfamily)